MNRTSWNLLPQELQLEIAKQTTTVERNTCLATSGYPVLPGLNTSFFGLSKENNRLFELVARDHLHVYIWGCECLTLNGNPLRQHLFDNFERNRWEPGIYRCEQAGKLNLSIIAFEIQCRQANCTRRAMKVTTFMAMPHIMLTFYAFLQSYVAEIWDLEIAVQLYTPRSTAQAIKILNDMRTLLSNIFVTPASMFPAGYDGVGFRADVGRVITMAQELIRTYEAQIDAMLATMQQDDTPLEQLVSCILLYEGTIDSMDIENTEDFSDWGNFSQTRRYLYDLGVDRSNAILIGVAYYMLSRPLSFPEQNHFHVFYDRALGQLHLNLGEADDHVWAFDNLVAAGFANPGEEWLVPTLYARIVILLAWARLNTAVKLNIQGYTQDQAIEDSPLPFDMEVQCLGDNSSGPFRRSAWGSPISMMLVAGKDLARIAAWGATLPVDSEGAKSISELVRVCSEYMAKIHGAQDILKEHGRAAAVAYLNEPFIPPTAGHLFPLTRKGEARVALHAELQKDGWGMN